jgi:putative ABC transport system permease protein
MKNRSLRIFNMVARLRPGVTLEQSAAELAAISGTLSNTYPATNENIVITPQSLYERTVGNVRPALLMILVTVALLLLIACANVANLLLARTTAREREMAVRAALGAGRARLMRQLATESVVLASLGGLLGLLITMWGVDVLPAILEARLPRAETIAIDAPVLIFTLMATLVTALFFGTAPALQMLASRTGALKDHARGVAGSSRGRRVRQVIIVAEVALAVTVIIGAGLLVRSFNVLLAQTPGFDPTGVVSFNVQLVSKPDGPARAQAASALMEHLASVPGVRSVGASTGFPTVTPQRGTRFELDGRQLTPDQSGAYLIAATPGYFDALRTPVLRGRSIAAADRANAEPVVLINQTLASALFGGDDPVGRRLRIINPEHSNAWRTIVGVVGDVRYQGLDREVQPTIYTSFAQTPMMWLYVMARTDGNPSALAQTIRSAVSAFDPSLTAANVRPMPEVIAGTVDEPRFQMTLVSGFALLALVLAAIGIYGVIAYSVTQRTHELGVRVALGASGRDVMKMVLGEGLLVTTIGVAAGLLASFMLTRLMASMLFGVTARDPIAFSAGASVLLAVALLASWIPARRATRVDPVVALRAE